MVAPSFVHHSSSVSVRSRRIRPTRLLDWRDANQVEAVYPASTQPFLLNTVKTHRVKGRNNGGQRVKKGDLKSQNLLSLLEKRRQITPGH